MKRLALPLTLLCLALLAGCSAPVVPTASPSNTPTQTAEFRPNRTLQPGWTQLPTATPGPTRTPWPYKSSATPTSTSVPTLTPYPTLNLAAFQTFTPAPPSVCPAGAPVFDVFQYVWEQRVPPNMYCGSCEVNTVKGALEQGATLAEIEAAFQRVYDLPADQKYFDHRDLTGDGVDEMVVPHSYGFSIFGCVQLTPSMIFDYLDTGAGLIEPYIYEHKDHNRNGIAEIFVFYTATTASNAVVDVLEWNGKEFVQLIESAHMVAEDKHQAEIAQLPLWVRALYWNDVSPIWLPYHKAELNSGEEINIEDINGDGVSEIILIDSGPRHWDTKYTFGPWRGQRLVYQWDGLHYLLVSRDLDPPEYRFQAVQDADRLFLLGEYDTALKLYQDVIFSDQLKYWTPEMRIYLREMDFNPGYGLPLPALPPADPDEYPTLAAYARYRILLHHLARGWEPEAKEVYQTLLEKVPPGSPGEVFAELAQVLWKEYHATGQLSTAC